MKMEMVLLKILERVNGIKSEPVIKQTLSKC
jgi:hypothetical protein